MWVGPAGMTRMRRVSEMVSCGLVDVKEHMRGERGKADLRREVREYACYSQLLSVYCTSTVCTKPIAALLSSVPGLFCDDLSHGSMCRRRRPSCGTIVDGRTFQPPCPRMSTQQAMQRQAGMEPRARRCRVTRSIPLHDLSDRYSPPCERL